MIVCGVLLSAALSSGSTARGPNGAERQPCPEGLNGSSSSADEESAGRCGVEDIPGDELPHNSELS